MQALGLLSYIAVRNQMTINSAYLAQVPQGRVAELCDDLVGALQRSDTDADAVYVPSPEYLIQLQAWSSGRLTCGSADGFILCVDERRPTTLARLIRDLPRP